MEQGKNWDTMILLTTLSLVGVGIVMIYSSSFILARERYGEGFFFLKKVIILVPMGITLMLLTAKIKYQLYSKLAYPLLFLSLILLCLVWVPGLGREAGGSTRWIKLAGLSFQPSEFAKLSLIIFLSYRLSKNKNIKEFYKGYLPLASTAGIVLALIIMEPDFGTTFILGTIAIILFFAAGMRMLHLLPTILGILPILYFLSKKFPYWIDRVLIFQNPWQDPFGKGFHLIQSLLAFGAGGIFGVGLGEGKQKLYFLPEPHNDFIFSIIGEELGLVGVTIILIIFFLLIYRGIEVSIKAPDLFGTFLALGITSIIGLQAFTNMSVTMGILPTKGLTLPFISYGGTSLIINLIEVGILLNISSQILRNKGRNRVNR